MVLIVFFVILILAFAVFILYTNNASNLAVKKSYYLRRFLRNKLQMEKYIEELDQIIKTHNCGSNYFIDGISLDEYLLNLKEEYKKSYADFNLKILKKPNLKDKHKKFYAKMLIKQSEKLYFIETEILKISEIHAV